MKKVLLYIPALFAGLMLAGCASDSTRSDTDGASSTSSTTSSAPAPAATSTPTPTVSMPSGTVIYFELDSSKLSAAGQTVVADWAKYLAANPGTRVRLEGHADERGTREYNIGLGERRASAVQKALTARGASSSQLTVTSFGEERPASTGHDEAAWSKNRRVEIVK